LFTEHQHDDFHNIHDPFIALGFISAVQDQILHVTSMNRPVEETESTVRECIVRCLLPEDQIMGIDITFFRYLPIGTYGENVANQGEHCVHDEIIVIRSFEPILRRSIRLDVLE
jgi:hypothetical protein